MALSPGTRLGPYEIQSALGAGGMGEVYRARDAKLHRDVALKILPELFGADPDRLARFQREARVLASLNHPHIGAIYGLEDSGGAPVLVLELVEGPTLAERIAQGPLPLDEALPIADQIADALAAAHERGIIHRDLKPANVKLRPDGAVKVLDFGLAKALEPARPSGDVAQSPTITSPAMTQMGMILGTAAYMSPEQAKGRPADKRSDVWAFGCLLFEMLTGQRVFGGEDVADTLALVLTKEPPWSLLPPETPLAIRRLLRRCLERDRNRRLADVADARLDLDEALSSPRDASAVAAARQGAPTPRWRRTLPWAVAATLGVAVVALLVRRGPSRDAPSPAPMRLSAELGAEARLLASQALALSPHGNALAFRGQASESDTAAIYVRRLDQLSTSRLSGTDGAVGLFFSPDGQWIAFFDDGKLKKIPVTGGAAVTIADAPFPRGGSWAEDDTIVFASDVATGLLQVSSAGGHAEPLTTLDQGEVTHRLPHVLPGGKAVLYTSHRSTSGFDAANLVVQPLPDGARKVVIPGGYNGRYLHSGHLVFIREGTLFAAPFDLDELVMTGPAVPVVEGVMTSSLSGLAHFAVSNGGTLMYVPGPDFVAEGPILWTDRQGKTAPLRATPSTTANLHFSPDGRRLALDVYDGEQWDVWVHDWARDTSSRLTFDATNEQRPVWTPDGRRLVFTSTRGDQLTQNLYWQRSDGTGEVQRLTNSGNQQAGASWHPAGTLMVFTERHPQTLRDLMILPVEGDETSGWKPGEPTVFLNSRFEEQAPMFSPDGRWLAYHSNESGGNEVYVRPFPGPGGKYQVSAGGGSHAMWSPARHELYYISNGRIMVVPYTVVGDAFSVGKPALFSEAHLALRGLGAHAFRGIDLHPDGQRFAFAALPEDAEFNRDHVTLIFNFFDELRRIAPAPRR